MADEAKFLELAFSGARGWGAWGFSSWQAQQEKALRELEAEARRRWQTAHQKAVQQVCCQLYEEGAENGTVMCIPLHPFLVGQPHRLKPLPPKNNTHRRVILPPPLLIATHQKVWT